MRSAASEVIKGGSLWAPQLYTEVEEDLFVQFPCQGMVGRYGTTEWCFDVREVLGLIVDAMRQSGDDRAEWLDCLATSFYGALEPGEHFPKAKPMNEFELLVHLETLVIQCDAARKSIIAGDFFVDEWGTALGEAPPTTIAFTFPCRKLVKSDEDLWTFPARWVLKLIEADLIRRNDPEAKDFRDLVAFFYPKVQPEFWSTIGAIPS